MAPPPLVGDAQGNYRVQIVGNSGTGKESNFVSIDLFAQSTLSILRLRWKPNWQKATIEEMRAAVEQALTNAPNGWVVDGNYKRSTVIEDNSTDVIWLDPPLALYFPRIIWRTFLRMLGLHEPCSPGCREMVSEVFFSKESIVWWCITNHRPVRRRQTARMAQIGIGIGSDVGGQKMRRIGGWGGELRAWFRDVKRMRQSE
ncbi:hypothetical protein MVEN_00259800 [Mycena venus]|uniref:Uncharacterized protein n=1 Tax=Mycena venus TaxID=2733690 RepID=A0A8H6Z2T5_9AGAR|nr:hypothetical protein MVEN_00259800 [Mycena venus]